MTLMGPSKETDNKLRWQANVDGVEFKLYIPKARVPYPWPKGILVELREPKESERQHTSPTDLEAPIIAIVGRKSEHSQTARFTPYGDATEWEVGEPYIPYNLLPTPSISDLCIKVTWDRSSGTWNKGD